MGPTPYSCSLPFLGPLLAPTSALLSCPGHCHHAIRTVIPRLARGPFPGGGPGTASTASAQSLPWGSQGTQAALALGAPCPPGEAALLDIMPRTGKGL